MFSGVDLKLIIAILASLLVIVGGYVPYFRDIFLKKTKPHAYTWLIWAITQGTAVAGLWYGKGGWGAVAMSVGMVCVFFVFLISLKYGTRNITKSDTLILIAALLAIVIWWQAHNLLLAVLMVSVIDGLGYWPSFRKTFEEPWTETVTSWVVFSLSQVMIIFSLAEYNFLTLVYLITITVANVILITICLFRRRVVPRHESIPDLYNKVEKFVVEALAKAHNENDTFHAKRTAYWIKKLKPEADEALLVAGLSHDIERAFYGDWKAGSDDPKMLRKHQDLSAFEIEKFLRQEKVDEKTIERVKKLVAQHEEGGAGDQQVLCDADCLAYFEEKALRNAKKYKQEGREEEMKKKLKYVFGRISSSEAKRIAKSWYDEAMKELN